LVPEEDTANLLLIAVASILVKALLEATETALISVRRARLTQLQEDGNKRAARVLQLLENPARFTTSIDRVGEVASVAGAVAAWLGAAQLFHTSPLGSHAAVLGLVLYIAALFFFGNVVPKTLASLKPDWLALATAGWVDRIAGLVYPPVTFLERLAGIFVKAGGGEVPDRSPYVTEEEIKIFAEQGVEVGELEEEEKEMIHSIFEFTDTIVREVMVPRIDITAVDIEASLEEVLEAILKEGHSRIPVYEGTIDNIIGILHARDVLDELARAHGLVSRGGESAPAQTRSFSLAQMRADGKLRPPYFIPENKKISELLREFRTTKTPIAIVVDEYGGTAGLVTIEDLLEEIVGEIMDEWDEEEVMVRPIDENCAVFDARTPIEDVNETLSVSLPDDEFETIGGFVFGLFGKLPSAGETISYQNVEFTVENADGHRITEVRVRKSVEEGEPESASNEEKRAKPKNNQALNGEANQKGKQSYSASG